MYLLIYLSSLSIHLSICACSKSRAGKRLPQAMFNTSMTCRPSAEMEKDSTQSRIQICVYVHVYVYVCLHVYVSVYIYIYTRFPVYVQA